jgi:regulator of protease activity HflC (stomatin/prohibitin superfamily)
MAIKAVIGTLIGLFAVGILAGVALIAVNSARGRKTRMGVVVLILGIVGTVLLVPLNAGLVLIQPNEVGVVFRQTAREVLREPLTPGLKWVLPFVDQVTKYDIGQQSVTMAGAEAFSQTAGPAGMYTAVRATSSDGQIIFLDVTVIFNINSAEINNIHRDWLTKSFVDGFIVPRARSEVRNAVSGYSAEEVYSGGRATLETQILDALTPAYAQRGFLLSDVLIRDVSFSQEFTDAIEQKQIAEQEAERARFRVQQAAQEAEQARVEAQGRADSVVIAAEGDAQATVLNAEAEAKALSLINEILSQNPNLLQYQYISQLGDNIQLIIIPSNSPFLFDLQSLTGQAGYPPIEAPPTALPEAPPVEEGQGE